MIEVSEYKQFISEQYPVGSKNINSSIVYQMSINAQGAAELADYLSWSIEKLNLNLYFIGNEGMQAIIKGGSKWPTLKQIMLQKNSISCEGLKNIAQAQWKQLKKINLNKNNIKSEGFVHLVQADWPQLEQFEISHSQIGLAGALKFDKINWPILKILNLNYNLITDQGVRELVKCNFLNLQVLELSNNKLYAKSMYYLSQIELPNLKNLALNRNLIGRDSLGLTERGSIYLTKLKVKSRPRITVNQQPKLLMKPMHEVLGQKCQGLQQLHIFGNDISVNGIREIMYSGILAENCFLEIIRNHFTYWEIQEDIKACKIFSNQF